MAFRDKILALLDQVLKERPHLFLVDISISEAFKVTITLDGDTGVNLQDCIAISKSINNNLDREEQDYALEVASAGVSAPLKLVRQYYKNVGRTLKVSTSSETIEAVLEKVTKDTILVSWTSREPKKIGKGKETVEHKREIPHSEIKEAIVIIIFN